jgi:hypothetical protein
MAKAFTAARGSYMTEVKGYEKVHFAYEVQRWKNYQAVVVL